MPFSIKSGFLTILYVFSMIMGLFYLVFHVLLVFSYTPDLGGVENSVIYSVCKMLNGLPLYGDTENANFDITQYSPLYYYLHYFIADVLSLHPLTQLHEVYIVGRILSLVFGISGFVLIVHILSKLLKTDKRIAFIAGIIQFFYLTKIHFASRPDALFSLVFIVFVYLMIAYLNKKEHAVLYLYAAAVCAVFSMFIKQNGIQLPVILGVFLMFSFNWKIAIKSGITMFVLTGMLYYIFTGMYGVFFFKNIFGGLDNGVSFARVYDVFSNFHLHSMLIFAVGIFLTFKIFKKDASEIDIFFSVNLIVLFCFAFLTSAKEGSWKNYYNEFIIVSIIGGAAYLGKAFVDVREYAGSKDLREIVYIYILVLIPSIGMYNLFHVHYTDLKKTSEDYREKQQLSNKLNTLLQKYPAAYFVSFETEVQNMIPEKAVVPNKDIVGFCSKFNYDRYREKVKNAHIKYMILSKGEGIPAFLQADYSGFKRMENQGKWDIWENTKNEASQ